MQNLLKITNISLLFRSFIKCLCLNIYTCVYVCVLKNMLSMSNEANFFAEIFFKIKLELESSCFKPH